MSGGGVAHNREQTTGEAERLSPADRARWVAYLPGFGELPPEVLDELAGKVEELRFAAGDEVLREGEEGDRFFLIVEGHAEVTTRGGGGPVPLALLGPAEWFGELALLFGDRRRCASVTALTPLVALALPGSAFAQVLDRGPELRAAWEAAGELLLRAKFIKEAAPFLRLPADRLRPLARRLERRSFLPGEAIVRQGEAGDECHLIQRGRVSVVLEEGGGERTLAELGPGTLFGEVALLSEGPRSATVRALEPCETLVLRRADLLAALDPGRSSDRLVDALLRRRARLHRQPGVEVHTRVTPEGETVTVLKEPVRGAYLKLSSQGRFLWERLDGQHTLRDIVVAYSREHGGDFLPDLFAELLIQLARTGFTVGDGVQPSAAQARPPLHVRLWRALRLGVSWQLPIGGADPLLEMLHRLAGRWLFTRPGAVGALAVGLLGLLPLLRSGSLPVSNGGAGALLFFFPAALLVSIFHELGHALAAKAFGREVPRVALGWRWFWPVAFADTSDTWLAEGRERMVVSGAGMAANWFTGGVAALGLLWASDPAAQMFLLTFALLSYLAVFVSLHPVFDLDGYNLLMDALERPDLRRSALRAVVERSSESGTPASRYAVAAVAYSLLFPLAMLLLYRRVGFGWAAMTLGPTVADLLEWCLVAVITIVTVLAVVRELKAK